jgi:diguanylate cyclase (GGDEF)-like protein
MRRPPFHGRAGEGIAGVTGRGQPRLLSWLTGGVIVAGLTAVAVQLLTLDADISGDPAWVVPMKMILVAVATSAVVRVRVRSANVGTAWTDAAILILIVTMPSAWVAVDVFTGVLIGKLFCRISPYKALYNAAKDTLSATAGLAVALHIGLLSTDDSVPNPLALLLVALTITATESVIGVPVLALASRVPWYRVHPDVDIKLAFFAGKFVVTVFILIIITREHELLAVVPPIALCLHMLYASRVRARSDRGAWQRLASTTEALNNTDLDAVLTAAVANAVQLFAAEEAEVFLRDGPDGSILVRGDANGVVWSGDPREAPAHGRDTQTITAPLAGDDRKADLGEVRLHYGVGVRLTDRELLTLRTFASALRTAVRNASAFAEARRIAMRNALAALHDPLTGLANRRRLQEYGEAALAQPGITALVVLDLDLFRDVNETLGYLAGDRLLVEVARRLSRATGPDDLVARLDGDEFAVVLSGVDSGDAAEQRVRELLATLDAPIDLSGMRVRVEACAGLAIAPSAGALADIPTELGERADVRDDAAAVVELLRRADVAMYQAKRGGPRIVRYEPGRDTADVAVLMLGGDLPRAIARREFTVNFQPIVDLATGKMIAAEALARWHHPDRGDLDPRRFLAAVERSGLLPAFAEAVLDQALAAMLRWRELGLDAPVAVNASPRNLLDPTFPLMVRAQLARHGVAGRDLVIELTETLTLTQVDLIGGVLRDLQEAGVRLALDDFGTRSSSLAMLAKVPFFELKVDRSFVAGMATSPEALAVVRSTVELGRSLGRFVVAEGVERDDQRLALWELGCPGGQGHLFAKPMPIDTLMEIIASGVDGVVGRIYPAMNATLAAATLPRMRSPQPDTPSSRDDAVSVDAAEDARPDRVD